MFRVPAVLGALALCAIYAVGCRLVRRPWLVFAALTALALSMPQLNASRDTFSSRDAGTAVGRNLATAAPTRSAAGRGLISGLALGGTLMTRIDAVAYLVPLPLLAAAAWLATRSADDRKSLLRLYAALVAGVLPPAILGPIDVQRRSGGYYDALSHEMHKLYTLLGLCLVLAVIVVSLSARLSARPVAWFVHRRQQISVVAAGVIGIGLILAWSVRPLMKGGKLSAAGTASRRRCPAVGAPSGPTRNLRRAFCAVALVVPRSRHDGPDHRRPLLDDAGRHPSGTRRWW